MEKKICILDTDIGDDIDDAFALALMLENDDIDLKAVTTVYKNTRLRAFQAKQLINAYKKDVKVYYGEGMPLSNHITPFTTEFVNETGDLINNKPCQYDESMQGEILPNAVDAIIELAKKYQNKLIIVTIGPLTNIAAAIKKEPLITKWVKRIYSMGGWFTNSVPEWNILCDAVAADIVYKSGIEIYSCGLDVTLKCTLDEELLTKLKTSEKETIKLLNKYFKRWEEYFHFEKSVMHDPLAITCVTDEVCTFKQKYVKVSLEKNNSGAVLVNNSPMDGYSLINVAEDVDRDKFYTIVMKRLFKNENNL